MAWHGMWQQMLPSQHAPPLLCRLLRKASLHAGDFQRQHEPEVLQPGHCRQSRSGAPVALPCSGWAAAGQACQQHVLREQSWVQCSIAAV